MLPIARALLLILLTGTVPAADAASFTITHVNAPAAEAAAIDHAADIWGGILQSTVPIKVRVTFFPLGANALGITFPNGRRDFPGAPLPQTWYASCLANSIAGVELNPGESDIDIYLNSATIWYTGTDGNPGAGQTDLVTVALHELGHGLGFVGLSKKVATDGSLGMLLASDFAPLTTSFPWPQLDTLPGVFDRYLSDLQDGPFTQMQNPGPLLGAAMTGNQVYFNGPLVMAANGGSAPRIYAPSVFALGSSCVHLNESTYPAGNPNELMTPFNSAGNANHWPGPLCIAMMQDIGWMLEADVWIADRQGVVLEVHPNPASDLITMRLPAAHPNARAIVTDPSGRMVLDAWTQGTLQIHALAPGSYVLSLPELGLHTRFVKE